MRYTYSHGYKSRDAAQEAIWDMCSDDLISMCEKPEIEGYDIWKDNPLTGAPKATKVRRYKITLEDGSY